MLFIYEHVIIEVEFVIEIKYSKDADRAKKSYVLCGNTHHIIR